MTKENRPPIYIEYLDYSEGERKPHPDKRGAPGSAVMWLIALIATTIAAFLAAVVLG